MKKNKFCLSLNLIRLIAYFTLTFYTAKAIHIVYAAIVRTGGTNLLRQFIALSRRLIKSANGWYHQDSSGRSSSSHFCMPESIFARELFCLVTVVVSLLHVIN